MQAILLVVHLLIAVIMIGLILLQRSEGGALGIGGGGGGGGFMTGRSTANFLTRATAVLAAMFFLTSMGLTYIGAKRTGPIVPQTPTSGAPATSGGPVTPGPAKPAGPSAPVK